MAYFKTASGCNLYYELAGQGPGKPVVTCINGTLQTTVNWKAMVKRLSHQFCFLIYDCRGQGASDLGDQPLSLSLHVKDLQELHEELKIRETHLVGLSHGARVALALADRSPEKVLRMVLGSISTRAGFRARMIVRSWLEILKRHSLDAMVWAAAPHVFGRNYLYQNEKVLDRMVKTIVRRNNTDALRAHLEALVHYPALAGELKRLPCLSLVVCGEDDPLVSAEGVAEMAHICGSRSKTLPGIGHSIIAEAPEQLAELVEDFLSTVSK
jgi:3-oxoadipate enol-lactonase